MIVIRRQTNDPEHKEHVARREYAASPNEATPEAPFSPPRLLSQKDCERCAGEHCQQTQRVKPRKKQFFERCLPITSNKQIPGVERRSILMARETTDRALTDS
ncbi:hypothetical protein [Paraburkholderia sp. J63]|uniref:hypothetical protein n=1 Tax=Paraburkholderia sp. J63 TaxID=2805434 RepID=UPI002ABDD06E|nr:hypothetical protein [Paraburkholderia sp. J63]